MPQRKCETCNAFQPQDRYNKAECRRHPPTVNGLMAYAQFPCVMEDWWCSEWGLNENYSRVEKP